MVGLPVGSIRAIEVGMYKMTDRVAGQIAERVPGLDKQSLLRGEDPLRDIYGRVFDLVTASSPPPMSGFMKPTEVGRHTYNGALTLMGALLEVATTGDGFPNPRYVAKLLNHVVETIEDLDWRKPFQERLGEAVKAGYNCMIPSGLFADREDRRRWYAKYQRPADFQKPKGPRLPLSYEALQTLVQGSKPSSGDDESGTKLAERVSRLEGLVQNIEQSKGPQQQPADQDRHAEVKERTPEPPRKSDGAKKKKHASGHPKASGPHDQGAERPEKA
jgi:hypothetical protein